MTNKSIFSPLELFDTLRAEDEAAWLARAFIPPSGFETMRGMRSIIVFGEEGSGKTALQMALISLKNDGVDGTVPFVVEWKPGIQREIQGDAFVAQFIDEILDLTAQNLARRISYHPECFGQASRWVQEAIIWLIHKFLQTNLDLFLMRLEDSASPNGLRCLKEIFSSTPKTLVSPSATYPRQITEVVQTLKAVGFSGLWVMIDGLEAWISLESVSLGKLLTVLFSTLALFDVPGFAVKVMAPSRLKHLISNSTGLSRRRFDIFDLVWSREKLRLLCENRLALACRQDDFLLGSLSEDSRLLNWLECYGGVVPRGWLEFLRAFLDAYLAQPHRMPLTSDVLTRIQNRFPPRLRIDSMREQVFLGYQPIADLSGSSLAILRYLYSHPVRSCNKEELYYRVLRGLDHEPRVPDDPGWEAPKNVQGAVDTALWRLRQSLEPNPSEPIYIVSSRGKRIIRLENAW